jgi:hypothetical protein
MSSFIKRHFNAIERLLKSQSYICQTELPDYDIGMNREFFVREVLKNHLPPACSITSGSICDQDHSPSGQVDIILFHPLSPRISIGASDCCLSESVFSAIEVKSRLSEDHFRKSVRNLAEISALSRKFLYTDTRGATASSEAYHFNTIGTVLFGFKGYSPETCLEALRRSLQEDWQRRPEIIYCLDKGYILVRDDYLRWEESGVLKETGSSWIERLSVQNLEGYHIIKSDCLLILVTVLSKRVQCNYQLYPMIWNYVAQTNEGNQETS